VRYSPRSRRCTCSNCRRRILAVRTRDRSSAGVRLASMSLRTAASCACTRQCISLVSCAIHSRLLDATPHRSRRVWVRGSGQRARGAGARRENQGAGSNSTECRAKQHRVQGQTAQSAGSNSTECTAQTAQSAGSKSTECRVKEHRVQGRRAQSAGSKSTECRAKEHRVHSA
jgi:hypothetical protein